MAGQSGNVREWEETEFDLLNDSALSLTERGTRGADWNDNPSVASAMTRDNVPAATNNFSLGFRVASTIIPEPGTLLLGMTAGVALLLPRWHRG